MDSGVTLPQKFAAVCMLALVLAWPARGQAVERPRCPDGTVERSWDPGKLELRCRRLKPPAQESATAKVPEKSGFFTQAYPAKESAPKKRPTARMGLMSLPGADARLRVVSLIGFVLPQIRTGAGSVPLKDVMAAMAVDRFLEAEDFKRLVARGDITMNGGRCANRGEAMKATIRLVVPILKSARFEIAESVSGDVAENADGGFTLSDIRGLSLGIPLLGMSRVTEISIGPDAVRVSRRFGVDLAIDLTLPE